MITVELTNEQFYDIYKNSEYIRGMSFAAVNEVLDHISTYEGSKYAVDWTGYFMNVSEMTEREFISEYSSCLEPDEIESYGDDEEQLAISIIENMERVVHIICSKNNKNTYVVM